MLGIPSVRMKRVERRPDDDRVFFFEEVVGEEESQSRVMPSLRPSQRLVIPSVWRLGGTWRMG